MAKVIIGTLIHSKDLHEIEILQDNFIIFQENKIKAIGSKDDLDESLSRLNIKIQEAEVITLSSTQFLIPGLIDTHIHAPQYPNIGLGYTLPLLEWLEKYTFALESKYSDLELSKKVYEAIVKKTVSFGTTTACYFASLFSDSSLILADSAIKFGQRAFIGKINMTQLSPDNYIESPQETIEKTLQFIEDVSKKNSPIVKPIITPRFAISVDMDVMKKLGEIALKHDLNIQTHISENKDEVKKVGELYKKPYAVVYDTAGLLTEKTVLAHGVHLTNSEMELLALRKTSIAHCPDSNTRLRSGLCDVQKLQSYGVNVSLGTDVSGGCSVSIIDAMRNALTTSMHLHLTKNQKSVSGGIQNMCIALTKTNKQGCKQPLNEKNVFYMATLGGAKALALEDKIGNFEVGKEFDALVIDMSVPNAATDLMFDNYVSDQLFQKFIYLGDDRNVKRVFVAGKQIK